MVTVTLEAPEKQHLNSSENYDFEETLEKQFSGGAAGFYPTFKRCLEASPYLMCSGMTPKTQKKNLNVRFHKFTLQHQMGGTD